jgi:hypothetical protein
VDGLLRMHVFAFNTFFDDVDRAVSPSCPRVRAYVREANNLQGATKIFTLSELARKMWLAISAVPNSKCREMRMRKRDGTPVGPRLG